MKDTSVYGSYNLVFESFYSDTIDDLSMRPDDMPIICFFLDKIDYRWLKTLKRSPESRQFLYIKLSFGRLKTGSIGKKSD